MSWISENKSMWRAAILVVGVVALLGPWTYDLINVPAEYACSPPNVRLEGDFCGMPLSGVLIYGGMIGGFVEASAQLLSGSISFADWGRTSFISLLLLLLLLPLLNTLLLVLRRDGSQRQMFSIALWGLAGGLSLVEGLNLLLSLSRFLGQFWALWGLWLYIALAIAAVALEVLATRQAAVAEKAFE